MILRTALKNPTVLLRVGMTLLALAIVSLNFVHPSTTRAANFHDAATGLIYGIAIGCLFLSIRARRGRRP